MNAKQWARVSSLFNAAAALAPAERERWLAANCDDQSTRAEVDSMLRTFDADPEFLEKPVDVADAVAHAVSTGLIGRRLGAYRIVAEIGHGGMGIVYEAQRDDQEFDRRVAIKILPVWSGADLVDRFRMERRVLAGLDHRAIARLIDSGTTDEGVPYFVMEYVDGKPVDEWCREQQLDIAGRITLIERVSDALAYAHQRLVIHRDVKPANILVTAQGEPKLLDFGIAALLTADGEATTGLTRTGQHSFTADYASPEQIRGEPVTTASDVYSLGVVSYLLLSGRLPYDLPRRSPLEALRLVCEVDPPLMSSAAGALSPPALRGDLDAIVARALRKVPGERYGTIAEFAADLRAWRSGMPVSAAQQSFAYHARRFVRRHRAGVAAAAVLVLALAGGGVATAWQARIASQERDKAQNRFRQVQEFSRSLLVDVHSALRTVPGATASQRLLLDRAVRFMDGLAADAGDDDELQLELAAGYQQLANIQGNSLSNNVGDTAAAATSLEKAVRLVNTVRERRPQDLEPLIRAVGVHFNLASVLDERDDATSKEWQTRHESLVRELETHTGAGPRVVGVVAKGYSDVGRFRVNAGDFAGAEQPYRNAVRLFETISQDDRDATIVRDHAFALKRLGALLLRAGKYDESEQRYRQALPLDELSFQLDGRPETRYDITFTLSDLALVQSRRGEWRDAVEMWNRALEIRTAAADADPKNTRALNGVATLHGRLGAAAAAQKDPATSVAHYREELRIQDQLIGVTGRLPNRVSEQAWARLRLAEALLNRGGGPSEPARASWITEAGALVRSTSPSDGKASVPAGSEPGFIELRAALTSRLAAP